MLLMWIYDLLSVIKSISYIFLLEKWWKSSWNVPTDELKSGKITYTVDLLTF